MTLFDADGRIRQQFDALPGAVIDLDVAPDGTWGVTVGGEGAVVLWDIDAATGRWSQKEVLTGAWRHRGDLDDRPVGGAACTPCPATTC